MRLIVCLAIAALAQLVALYLIIHRMGGDASGTVAQPLVAMLVMALAIPVGLVVNAWLVRHTLRWPLPMVLLVCIAQALLAPALIVAVFALID